MKKILIAALTASFVCVVAPAIAEPMKSGAPLQAEQLDQVTAGTSTISIRNRLNSRVNLKFENNVKLNGSDFKAAAQADVYSSIPAFTSAVAVSSGNTVIDATGRTKEWSSFAVSESAGAIMPLRPAR
jgi:hypothetical protein